MSVFNTKGEKIEALIYEEIVKGNVQTTYYAYLGDCKNQEEIDQKIASLVNEGRSNVRAVTWDEYMEIDAAESNVRYKVNIPQIIDKERFWECLEVLPPCRWVKNLGLGYEYFHISEAITHDLYTFCVRIGQGENAVYFEMTAKYNIAESELLSLCNEHLNKQNSAA